MSRFGLFRALTILLLASIVAAMTYALAASNSFSESSAGDGTAWITPYNVDSSSIHYTLDVQTRPTDITMVQFEFTVQASSNAEVYARLDNGDWSGCTLANGTTWSCSFSPPYPQARLDPPMLLEVVAAQ